MEIKMTFPHRLKLALFFICCMQHVYASTSSVNASSSSMSSAANSSTITQANSSTITQANSSTITQANSSTTAVAPTSTPMATTKKVSSTASEAPATATVIPTSTTHDTTTSPSAYVNNASAHVLTSSSMFTAPNVTINIKEKYSSPDCKSCSNGGTITVTKSCEIKIPSNDDKKCDKDEFNKTRCGYVTLADKMYRCAEVFKNYTNHVEKKLKIVKECNKECPASGSVLSPHLAFIFATGLVVGMLSQTL